MPIGTAHTGGSFRGVLNYALGKDRKICNPEIIGGTMTGETPRELAHEFAYTRRMRPDIARPVHHLTLSGCPGEKIGNDKWNRIAARHIENLGYDLSKTQYVVIRHHDTDREHWSRPSRRNSKKRDIVCERPADETGWKYHEAKEHIHILVSRIQTNERVFRNSNDRYKVMASCRQLEKEFNLQRGTTELDGPSAKRPNAAEVGDRLPTPREIKSLVDTGAIPLRVQVQAHIKEAAKGKPDVQTYIKRLEEVGVTVHANIGGDKCTGLAYSFGGQRFKGQDLGERFKWTKLQSEMGVTYEPKRDRDFLEHRDTRRNVSAGQQHSSPGAANRNLGAQNNGIAAIATEVSAGSDNYGGDMSANREIGHVGSSFGAAMSVNDGNNQRGGGRTGKTSGGFGAASGVGAEEFGRDARVLPADASLDANGQQQDRRCEALGISADAGELDILGSSADHDAFRNMVCDVVETPANIDSDRDRAGTTSEDDSHAGQAFAPQPATTPVDDDAAVEHASLLEFGAGPSKSDANDSEWNILDEHEFERFMKRVTIDTRLRAVRRSVNRRNGFVEYTIGSKLAVIDKGKKIAVIDHDDASIVFALTMARERFGSVLTTTGPDSFKEKVARLAAQNDVDVQFADSRMQQIMLQEKMHMHPASMIAEHLRDLQKQVQSSPASPLHLPNRSAAEAVMEAVYGDKRGRNFVADIHSKMSPGAQHNVNVRQAMHFTITRSADGRSYSYIISAMPGHEADVISALKKAAETTRARAERAICAPARPRCRTPEPHEIAR